MATREYKIVYTVDAAKALAEIAKLEARLKRLDKATDMSRAKLIAMGRAATPGMARMAKAIEELMLVLRQLGVRTDRTRQKVQALGGQATRTGQQVKGLGTATAQAGTTAQAASKKFDLLGISLKTLTVAAVYKAIAAIGEGLEKARTYAIDAAEKILAIRNSLRDLGNMQGKPGGSNEVAGPVLDLAMASGSSVEQAHKFAYEFESAKFASEQAGHWKLNPQQTAELKKVGLQYATAKGIGAGAFGNLMSAIGLNEDITSVDQALGKVAMENEMANEAVGTPTDVLKQARKLRGEMGPTGAVKTDEELVALVSTGTIAAGDVGRTAQGVRQAWRAVNAFGPGPQGKTLDKLGIKPGMPFLERIEKLKPLIDEANRPGGPGAITALKSAGFTQAEANDKLISWAQNFDILKNRIERARQGGNPAQVRADIAAFQQNNPDLMGKTQNEVADILRGQEQERLVSLRTATEGKMKLDHKLDTQWTDVKQSVRDVMGENWKFLGGQGARTNDIDTTIRQAILTTVPEAEKRFPRLSATYPNDPAYGEELAGILRKLSPEEYGAVYKSQLVGGVQVQNGQMVPAANAPAPAAAPVPVGIPAAGVPGAAPQAPGAAGPGPQASNDMGGVEQLLKRQVSLTEELVRKAAKPGGSGLAFNPNYGPSRPGSDLV